MRNCDFKKLEKEKPCKFSPNCVLQTFHQHHLLSGRISVFLLFMGIERICSFSVRDKEPSTISEGDIYSITADACTDCGTCAGVCPSELTFCYLICRTSVSHLQDAP